MRRVTITAVAEATGFSKTTVSFAFNNPNRIGKETRDKILTVAAELGYVPNPGARSLSIGRHGTIGLLLPQNIPRAFANPYMSLVLQGIGQVCENEGHTLTLIPPIKESLLVGARSAAVDGLITLGLDPGSETVAVIRRRHLPFVTIDGRSGNGFPVVGVRDRELAAEAMRYVLEQGHRRVLVVSLTDAREFSEGSYVRNERLVGYQQAFDESVGTNTASAELLHLACDATLAGGRSVVEQLRELRPVPTAVLVMSDIVALGIMERLFEIGLQVPGDISLVGFDDIPEAGIVRPQLTTVSQPGEDKGRAAAEILMRMLRGEHVRPETVLHGRLLLRGTVVRRTEHADGRLGSGYR